MWVCMAHLSIKQEYVRYMGMIMYICIYDEMQTFRGASHLVPN